MTNSTPRLDVLTISEWWEARQHEPGALTALKKVIDTISDATRSKQPASTKNTDDGMELMNVPNKRS